jgi:hypothetical protein
MINPRDKSGWVLCQVLGHYFVTHMDPATWLEVRLCAGMCRPPDFWCVSVYCLAKHKIPLGFLKMKSFDLVSVKPGIGFFFLWYPRKKNARSLFTLGKACGWGHYWNRAALGCCLARALIEVMPSPSCFTLHITLFYAWERVICWEGAILFLVLASFRCVQFYLHAKLLVSWRPCLVV